MKIGMNEGNEMQYNDQPDEQLDFHDLQENNNGH